MGRLVLERVIGHVASLERQPAVGDLAAEDLCRSMREPAPQDPAPLEQLLDKLFDEWIPRSYTSSGPGYLAYIPGGGVFPAALADLIADGTNRYTGIWQAAPALVQIEANVLDWLRDWMEFPPTTRGLFTTGGSMANFNAIVCARERLLGPHLRQGVLYTSTQAHHSVLKSARIAGILGDRVRALPVDSSFRMDAGALEQAILEDRRRGLAPFIVVSAAGTTNTGAVDPLDAITDICREHGLWHHVDGAYGACFYACEHLRRLLPGLPRVDSLTLDPHKGLFLPYGTGALLVADGSALRAVHAVSAAYLPAGPDADEFYDPSQHGPDLTRGFPGLRVWLAFKLYGARRIEAAIAEKRDLAVYAAGRIAALPGVVMAAPPQLSLFAFHLRWPGSTLEDENRATMLLLEKVRQRQRVLLTGCRVDGRFLARVCVLGFRTRKPRVDACIEDVTEESAAILELAASGAGRLPPLPS